MHTCNIELHEIANLLFGYAFAEAGGLTFEFPGQGLARLKFLLKVHCIALKRHCFDAYYN